MCASTERACANKSERTFASDSIRRRLVGPWSGRASTAPFAPLDSIHMLTRSARAARAPVARRRASTAAVDRGTLDIYAAHHAEQERAGGPQAVSKSPAARRGESLRGDVHLPRELQLATNAIVEGPHPLTHPPLEDELTLSLSRPFLQASRTRQSFATRRSICTPA